MSQWNDGPIKTYTASAVMAQYLRVKHVAAADGTVELAAAADRELGQLERPALAVGDDVPVRLRNSEGSCIMVANAAIAKGAEVFGAAGGKIAPSGANAIGTAEEAAGADGDYIEVLRY